MNRKWLFLIFGAVFVATGLAGFAMYKFVQDDVETVHERASTTIPDEPPKTATEILAAELSGAPEAFPKATEEDLARAPAESKASTSLEEEFDSMAPSREDQPEQAEVVEKKKESPAKRATASVPSQTSAMFKVESSKTVISKNLDRKKTLAQLRKDFSKDDCSANTGKTKALKAVIQLGKDGSIGKIKMQPSTTGDKDLTRCIRKKITAKAKAYKSKDKSGGKLTLQMKVK